MEQWTEIRRRVLVEGVSRRQIQRETGMHWRTVQKVLAHSEPPGYRRRRSQHPRKIAAYVGRIEQILKEDQKFPKKQWHTAKRIFERLREEGYQGGYTAVREVVQQQRQRSQEVFMPLEHRPGEAQVDFGHALANVGGRLRKVAFFVMALPYSDAFHVRAFERECTESFWEGHVRGFEFFGGVPKRISYDNTKVPVPQVRSLEELNGRLEQQCREDLARRLRGRSGTKAALLAEEQAVFLKLPTTPFEAARTVSTRANSMSLVRFDRNDYSVPVKWAHHEVVAKGYVDRVVLSVAGKQVAGHRRIWETEQVRFDPVHYLALLERKPGALGVARPLEGWNLPECFEVLHRRLEAQEEGEGTREHIRVLRLLERHSLSRLRTAVEAALRVGATTRDAVAQFLYPREDWRVTRFSLDGHPHLRGVRVAEPDLRGYRELLQAGGER